MGAALTRNALRAAVHRNSLQNRSQLPTHCIVSGRHTHTAQHSTAHNTHSTHTHIAHAHTRSTAHITTHTHTHSAATIEHQSLVLGASQLGGGRPDLQREVQRRPVDHEVEAAAVRPAATIAQLMKYPQ